MGNGCVSPGRPGGFVSESGLQRAFSLPFDVFLSLPVAAWPPWEVDLVDVRGLCLHPGVRDVFFPATLRY